MIWHTAWENLIDGSLILPNCTVCNGTGTVKIERLSIGSPDGLEETNIIEVACDCTARPKNLLDRANIPPGRFARLTLADLDWDQYDGDIIAAIREYAERLSDYVSKGIGLTLIGNVGTGKTHIAVGLIALACGLGIEARFVSMSELLARLRSSYDDAGKQRHTETEILDEFSSVPLLAVDDLGTGKPSDWVRDRFYFLINRRYNAALTTVITSNLSPTTLESRLGEATISRIWGSSVTVKFMGGDYRKRKKSEILEEATR